jgi:hypothetical protein
MPNVAAFYRDGLKANYFDIDRAICQALELPHDDSAWVMDWYGVIALYVALGKTLPEIVDMLENGTTLWRIACWLSMNYTTEAWYERK